MDQNTAHKLAQELAESTADTSITSVYVNGERYIVLVAPASFLANGRIDVGSKSIRVALLPNARLSNCPECGKPY